MINIDPNVFALLVKNTAPTNISIQNLSDQNLYFNDISVLPGSIMPHDNKTYMRCKRVGSKPTVGTVTPAPLLASKPKQSMFSGIQKQISETGIFPLLDVIILVLSLCIGLYYGYSLSNSTNVFYLLKKSESFASYVRSFFVRPTNI